MLGSIGTFESFGEESGSTYPKAGSRAIKYTVFCSPPFNKSPGMQCVSLRVVKAGNWACYVGAAPSYCDTSKGLNKYLGFAIDGTVRFQKAKIQSSSSDRKYADGEELCLTYEPANQTVTLWRFRPEELDWTELASFQGVPDDWRFACGVDCCKASFELLPTRMPPQALAAAGAPSPTPPLDVSDPAEPRIATPTAPPNAAPARVASSGNFADAQRQAAATTIQRQVRETALRALWLVAPRCSRLAAASVPVPLLTLPRICSLPPTLLPPQGLYNQRGKGVSKAGAAATTTFEFTSNHGWRTTVDGSTCKTSSTTATIFCSPPLSSLAGGQPSVRLRLKKTSNSNVYVGAAPADCKADRGLNKTGVGFAIDGTLRFQKTKIKSSGSGRVQRESKAAPCTHRLCSFPFFSHRLLLLCCFCAALAPIPLPGAHSLWVTSSRSLTR